ncbi:DUF2798 domain-containing protein [Shinella granuli]|uniref:DUF2798 domain-containing protein n=1 Tax=Shinella granuli TaxID=323621 RepID=UPI0010567CB8|nr:DUF2798 domain-containing protein [Shinella granuli]
MQINQKRSGLRKLPPSSARILMPLILSIFMSAIVSAVATSTSIGPGISFAATWPEAWGASWIVAFPTLLFALPIVRRIVAMFVEQST